jgi:hypothetical protein
MKLTQSNARSVTLKFSRSEFQNLSKAIVVALWTLVGARVGKPIPVTDLERQMAEVLLPKLHRLFDRITRIEIENGWRDDD